MGAPAIFEKQIEIKLLHPASTLESRIQVEIKLLPCIHFEVTDSGCFQAEYAISGQHFYT
ncbi:MAG: hypothetical protein P8X79_19695 [Reinekea sp.]